MGGHEHTPEAKAAGIHFSTLDLELARSPQRVGEIRDALGEKGRASMAWGATVQLLWPFFYANAIAAGIIALMRGARFKGRALRIARWMAWGACIAGICDFAENLIVILMLNGTYGSPIPEIKFVLTIMKFGLLVLALLYLLGAVGWTFRSGIMKHPLARIQEIKFKKVYTALFVSVLLVSIALMSMGQGGLAAKKDADGKSYDIVAFELAHTPAQAQHMVDTWGEDGIVTAKRNTTLDYLYLVLYSTLIAMGVLAIGSAGRFTGLMGILTVLLAYAQWIAALLDAVENTCLMFSLSAPAVSPWPEIAYYCASVKFGIIGMGVVFILALLPCVLQSEDNNNALLSQ